jgi:FdhD protein
VSLPGTAGECLRDVDVRRWLSGAAAAPALDAVVEETPVALSYNGISHVVMMMTPADLEDFAIGFSLSEGIVDTAKEIRDVVIAEHSLGVELAVTLSPGREHALKALRRNLTGRTGCGLCGAESLEQAIRAVDPVPDGPWIPALSVERACEAMPSLQALSRCTGGAHGAAWCAEDGSVRLLREDVGRHNALDKLVGAMARSGVDPAAGFVLVSSRASYEMVTKAARAGMRILAAVSAPTTLAVRLAAEANFTLVAFARPGKFSVYSAPLRLHT